MKQWIRIDGIDINLIKILIVVIIIVLVFARQQVVHCWRLQIKIKSLIEGRLWLFNWCW